MGAVGMELAHVMAADGVSNIQMSSKIARRLEKKVLVEDLQPDVAARLAKVVFYMEPLYHELFIAM